MKDKKQIDLIIGLMLDFISFNLRAPWVSTVVDVIKLFWRKSRKSRFPLKQKQQE